MLRVVTERHEIVQFNVSHHFGCNIFTPYTVEAVGML